MVTATGEPAAARPARRFLCVGLARKAGYLAIVGVAFLVFGSEASADKLEMLDGAEVSGEMLEETAEYVHFKVVIGKSSLKSKIPLEKIHAITVGEERRVVNEKAVAPAEPVESEKAADANLPPGDTRSRAEIQALVSKAGAEKPDWWDSVPLEYPKTLELRWAAEERRRPEENLKAYIIDYILPLPAEWKRGIKLMKHIAERNARDPRQFRQSMQQMGDLYRKLGDCPRAAYWYRRSGVKTVQAAISLAHCYAELGSRSMAAALLKRVGHDRTRDGTIIRAWGEIGETDMALAMAKNTARAGMPSVAYLSAGDALRHAGRLREAVGYYEMAWRAVNCPVSKRNRRRARDDIVALRAFTGVDVEQLEDGTYAGKSMGYVDNVEVEVTVAGGVIESVKVTRNLENRALSAVAEVPPRIVQKQGIKGVDTVTGATLTSEAIINAVARALAGPPR